MSKNKRHRWPELLREFNESGLTQSQFCHDKGINPNYFSAKRTQLLSRQGNGCNGQFVKAKIEKAEKSEKASALFLKLPSGELHFSPSVSPDYIASIIRALS